MSYSEPVIQPFIPGASTQNVHIENPFPTATLFPPKHPNTPQFPHVPLSSFHPFPHLPTELRIKIWHLLLPGPRIVKVRPYAIAKRKKVINKQTHEKAEFIFHSSSRPPILLFICRESRAEALRFYQLSFGFGHPKLPGLIYFNGEIDVLYFEFTEPRFFTNLGYFTSRVEGEGCTRGDMESVRKLALSHRLIKGRRHAVLKLMMRLSMFQGLREVIVAVERGLHGDERVVGNDAFLEELGDVDEDLRTLIDEVEECKLIWDGDDARSWKGRVGPLVLRAGADVHVPELKVMEVVNRKEPCPVVLPIRARKSRLGSLGDIFKRRF